MGPFDVSNDDLSRLGPQSLVDRFQDIIWADARRIGVPLTQVNITSRITVSDGGIDASINYDITNLPAGDVVIGSRVGYQLKAGTTFDPSSASHIQKELFGKENGSARQKLRKKPWRIRTLSS